MQWVLYCRHVAKSYCSKSLQKLDDYQLALLISRLVEGDGSQVYKEVLTKHVLPLAESSKDNCLASVAQWLLKNYADSVKTLLPKAENRSDKTDVTNVTKDTHFNPAVLHFFNFLSDVSFFSKTLIDHL